jgi:PPM family protein phosphatase
MSSAHSDTVELTITRTAGMPVPAQPKSMQVAVDLGAATHAGRVRPNNEDSYLVARADRSLEMLLTNLPPGDVPGWAAERCYGFAVADGMGGEAAGEVASQVALRAVVENVLATADWIMRDIEAHSAQIEERLAERFAAAGEAVKEQSRTHPRWFGMGTTMTMAVSSGAILFVGHIGDSRAYLLRGGQLQSLTRDHSFAQALAETGVISPHDAARHRMRNVLLRFVGGQSSNADLRHLPLLSGDQLLLCTDGLTDMLSAAAIGKIMQAPRSAQAVCDDLVAAALDAGGKDNVTVLLARYAW